MRKQIMALKKAETNKAPTTDSPGAHIKPLQ